LGGAVRAIIDNIHRDRRGERRAQECGRPRGALACSQARGEFTGGL
jgi:hypothetical protein